MTHSHYLAAELARRGRDAIVDKVYGPRADAVRAEQARRLNPLIRTNFLAIRVALCILVCAAGCNSRPVAPKLDPKERVYHNDEEGFQFEVPATWSRHGNARYPPQRHEKELVWVKYCNLKAKGFVFFRASFLDLPESTTVAGYLAQRPPGPEEWRLIGQAEKMTLDGTAATRYRFTGTWDKDAMVKEVVAVPRGQRTIFFTGIYPVKDTASRDAVRAICKTIRWDVKQARL